MRGNTSRWKLMVGKVTLEGFKHSCNFAHISKHVQQRTAKRKNPQMLEKVHKHIQQCTDMHNSAQAYATLCRHMHQCIQCYLCLALPQAIHKLSDTHLVLARRVGSRKRRGDGQVTPHLFHVGFKFGACR